MRITCAHSYLLLVHGDQVCIRKTHLSHPAYPSKECYACQLNAGTDTGFKYVRCVFWAWCHGYIVALRSNILARSFNAFYQQTPALDILPGNYWQHWWLHANGGSLALASETRS